MTRGNAPDTAIMNARVRHLVARALESQGVEEIIKLGPSDTAEGINIFDPKYLVNIDRIKLPYPDEKLLYLAREIRKIVDDIAECKNDIGQIFDKEWIESVIATFRAFIVSEIN